MGIIVGVVAFTFGLGQVAAQDGKPVVSLGSSTAVFTEDEEPVVVFSDLTISDPDGSDLRSATVTLVNRPDAPDEQLMAQGMGTISVTYSPGNGVLQLTGLASIDSYQSVLRGVTYNNNSQAPDTADRAVTVTVSDGVNSSEVVTAVVTINAVNDAPILDATRSFRLTDIPEDKIDSAGDSVEKILNSDGPNAISDVDATTTQGIAITSAEVSNGTWQFSTSAGVNWQALGPVSNSAAVLLNETARLRFVPDSNFSGPVTLSFRAWDQSNGSNGQTNVSTAANGGTTAFSTAVGTATLNVISVNDPPVLDLNGSVPGLSFSTNFVGGAGPVRIVAADATVTDEDNGSLSSATITLKQRPDGEAEMLAANTLGTTITLQPYNPSTGVLRLTGLAALEDYQSVLRTVTYNNSETDSLTTTSRAVEFVVSDGTNNSAVVTATIAIKPSNAAPVLDPTQPMALAPVVEDDENPAGSTVLEIIESAPEPPITDPDADALLGFAVVGVDDSNGRWQYTVAEDGTWTDFGVVSDTAAVLLDTFARIRFLPQADFAGASAITVRAWDQSSGSSGSREIDVSTNGGSTAFSNETAEVSVEVTAVNDAPVLTLPAGLTAVFVEGAGPVTITGPSLELSDIDHASLISATVRIENYAAGESDMLDVDTAGSGITRFYDRETGTLLLEGEASVANYQAVLRAINFENRSQDPDDRDRIVSFQVSDGEDASNVVTSTVSVQPVNDAPVIDLNGPMRPGTDTTVAFLEDAGPVAIAQNIDLQDVDNTTLGAATVILTNRPDGAAERLAINVEGTNLTASYEPTSGQLTLVGVDTIAAYEQALRTVTYDNSRTRPLRANRIVQFIVSDGTNSSDVAISTIFIRPQLTFLPVVANGFLYRPLSDEPNNNCGQAYPLLLNETADFLANDRDDWYTFVLPSAGSVRVELTNFLPEEGQVLVASGSCADNTLVRIGQNGNFATTKVINLPQLAPGRYYIWVINDGPTNIQQPYNLRVRFPVP